jgi:Integral peroxisomal membrane peroxin
MLRTRITLFLTPPSLLLPHLSLPGSQPLIIRLCASWPIWLLITHKILPPRMIVMALGTSALCWSSPWARVICIALWRSRTVRKVSGLIIGEDLLTEDDIPEEPAQPSTSTSLAEPQKRTRHEKQSSTNSIRDVLGGGIKITQTLYQSQRRWIGMGWTNSLFPNDKSAWFVPCLI